ncbi:hypothetical protein [Methylobrevis pamukkalensis]|uniref:Uncharacterized protein n=1 Tax=Methylobrevis pamukkalensis TaxID=1439726 RepID=A0A1E3GXK5_9HYPH|nr:hypothetical protein [Methylobrevis pamukkalensis]ODN68797.1 hypothetical protein A6302_03898 [Methylobrevis pamukkalensis]
MAISKYGYTLGRAKSYIHTPSWQQNRSATKTAANTAQAKNLWSAQRSAIQSAFSTVQSAAASQITLSLQAAAANRRVEAAEEALKSLNSIDFTV